MVDKILYTKGFWTVSDVKHRENILTVDVLDGLLPKMTHSQAINFAKNAKPDEFIPASLPFNFAVAEAVYSSKDIVSEAAISFPGGELKQTLRYFLRDSMHNHLLLTLTEINYQPSGEDEVIHFDIVDKKLYQQKVNVAGPNRFIEDADKACLERLLGTGDISKINTVFNWMSYPGVKANAYIRRLNDTPGKINKGVAYLSAYYSSYGSTQTNLDCTWSPESSISPLGVRIHAA